MTAFKSLLHILRTLLRNPGYSAAFILTLGLGIGANTAIFSVVNGVLLRPLPYPDADRIVYLRQPATQTGIDNRMFSFVEIADYREQARTIDEFIEFGDWTFNVLERGEPHRATGGLVTANYFTVLGLRPLLGRTLSEQDESPGAPPVAVLTYEYWQRVFGSDPAAVGQILDLTVKRAEIVGVLRPGSHYATMRKQDFYTNYTANDHYMSASMQDDRVHRMTDLFARLAPGAGVEAARAELQRIKARLHAEYPDAYPPEQGMDIVVTPWIEELTQRARPTLLLLLATAGFVLVIACANVANLTLTRLIRRERELAIRAAVGAAPGRLRRFLLGESLLLSLAGAVLGVVFAGAGLNLLVAYTARFTSRTGEIAVDGWVLFFTLLIAVGAAAVFAWSPGGRLARDLSGSLSAAPGARATGSLQRRRLQRLLVVGQLALSFMLLIGAGLLVRSLIKLHGVDPGFDLDNVLTMEAPDYSQQDRARRQQFGDSLVETLSGQGAVRSAALAANAPLGRTFPIHRQIRVEGQSFDSPVQSPLSMFRYVTDDYFGTIGTPLLLGRDFEATDGEQSTQVAVLSKSMAEHYFPDQDAVGRRLSWKFGNGQWSDWITVVGVVADTKSDGIERQPVHTLYRPARQTFPPSTVLVRTAGDPKAVTPYVVEQIRALDPNRPVDHIYTLKELRDENIAPQRLNAALFGLFAGLALVIAAVGVAGVLAFQVSQRMHEIGIRMALGASKTRILAMVLREGALLAVAGLLLGGLGALLLARFLAGLLFEVEPLDPLTFVAVGVTLLLVACAASLLPARRATRADPMISLRAE